MNAMDIPPGPPDAAQAPFRPLRFGCFDKTGTIAFACIGMQRKLGNHED